MSLRKWPLHQITFGAYIVSSRVNTCAGSRVELQAVNPAICNSLVLIAISKSMRTDIDDLLTTDISKHDRSVQEQLRQGF